MRAAFHLVLVFLCKFFHDRVREAQMAPAFVKNAPAENVVLALPAAHRLGGHMELFRELFQSHHRFFGFFDRARGQGSIELIDERDQVVAECFAGEHQFRVSIGAKAGDAKRDVLIRVAFARLNFRKQLTCLRPLRATLGRRRVTDHLVRELFDSGDPVHVY